MKVYFLIPTLLSVKLKVYLFEGLLFYNEDIYFEKALCHPRGVCVEAADGGELRSGGIVHYQYNINV